MQKRSLSLKALFIATAMMLAVCTCTAPALAGPVKLNYANFPPAPTFPCVQMERWKTEVEKRTANAVSIDTFPGGTLLGAKDMIDGVIAGQADIGCLCMAYQPGRFVVTNATSLPLEIPDSRTGSLALLELFETYSPKEFEKVKVLTMFTTAPTNIMSKEPIRTLEDINGFNLRASGGATQILKAWNANPVGMPMPETVEALQKGIVNGLFSSLEVMKDFKFAESCKYVTMTDTVIYPFAVVMNLDKWNTLSPEVKAVMMDLKKEQAEWTGRYMDQHVAEAVAWSKAVNNVEFISLSAKEKQQWNDRLSFLTDEWISTTKAKGLPAEQIVSDIRGFTKKYAGN